MIDAGQLHLIELLLSIAGFLILFLLGIIGFWIQKWIKSTDALTEAISDLRVQIANNQINVESLKQHCTAHCTMIDRQMNIHSKSKHQNHSGIRAGLCCRCSESNGRRKVSDH